MNCQDVQSLLGPFIDEEVTVDVLALINSHLIDCRNCEEDREALVTIRACIREHAERIQPPVDFVDRLKEDMQRRRIVFKRKERLRKLRQIVPLGVIAATVLCCLIQPSILKTGKTVSVAVPKSLTAHALYSY